MAGCTGTSFTIITNHNSSQSMTVYDSLRSLVLIYESATSTATALNDDCLMNSVANESLDSLTTESLFSAQILI
jgi:hypothetical protein